MKIRAAMAQDAGAIAAFWNPQILETAMTFRSIPKTAEEIVRDISTRDVFLVAEAAEVIGFATYAPFRAGDGYRYTMEHSVILAPGAQGRGIGRALMNALEERACAAGIHSLIAGISAENPGAVKFHEKLGFAHAGRMRQAGYKFDRWLDLILMQKFLTRPDNSGQSL